MMFYFRGFLWTLNTQFAIDNGDDQRHMTGTLALVGHSPYFLRRVPQCAPVCPTLATPLVAYSCYIVQEYCHSASCSYYTPSLTRLALQDYCAPVWSKCTLQQPQKRKRKWKITFKTKTNFTCTQCLHCCIITVVYYPMIIGTIVD